MKGSVTKRQGKTGVSWYGKFDYRDPNTGQRHYGRASAKTKKECEQKLREAIAESEKNNGIRRPDPVTFKTLAARWLASIESTIKPGTYRSYEVVLRVHLVPAFGDRLVSAITVFDVQKLILEKQDDLAPGTVAVHLIVLQLCLEAAIRWDLVDRNVARLVKAPRIPKTELAVWSPEQVALFLEEADKTPIAALWRIAVLCGVRQGELIGLVWNDVDFQQGALSIQRTRSLSKEKSAVLASTKTAASNRRIAMPKSCLMALQQQHDRYLFLRQQLGEEWNPRELVFTNATGQMLNPTMLRRHLARLIKNAALPAIRFHDLRHTSATLALAAGQHPKLVQDRLGHANIAMTLDRYSHVSPVLQDQAAQQLDEIIQKPVSGKIPANDSPPTENHA